MATLTYLRYEELLLSGQYKKLITEIEKVVLSRKIDIKDFEEIVHTWEIFHNGVTLQYCIPVIFQATIANMLFDMWYANGELTGEAKKIYDRDGTLAILDKISEKSNLVDGFIIKAKNHFMKDNNVKNVLIKQFMYNIQNI
jgi:hypothetical protein